MIGVGYRRGVESQIAVNLHSIGCFAFFARLVYRETDDMGRERQIGKRGSIVRQWGWK